MAMKTSAEATVIVPSRGVQVSEQFATTEFTVRDENPEMVLVRLRQFARDFADAVDQLSDEHYGGA